MADRKYKSLLLNVPDNYDEEQRRKAIVSKIEDMIAGGFLTSEPLLIRVVRQSTSSPVWAISVEVRR